MTKSEGFKPDWVSPPGDTIADALEEMGLSQSDLAARTGFTQKHVNSLIRGRAAITADAAVRLEAVLGEPSSFWLRREAQYREALARRRQLREASKQTEWLDEIPVGWLRRQQWIERHPKKEEQVAECLRFFGVASVRSWHATYSDPLAAYRESALASKRVGAVAAWLRTAEILASQIECSPYSAAELRSKLPELRSLTREPDPRVFVARIRSACAACGVAVVFTPAPPKCPLYGVTRWLTSSKALVALSLRYKTNDQLWFSFFHELAHVIKHGKKLLFVEGIDGLDDELEDQADRFAANFLIPQRMLRGIARLRTAREIQDVASDLGIAPGIVLGRMQREGWVDWSKMNHLKIRYQWNEAGFASVS